MDFYISGILHFVGIIRDWLNIACGSCFLDAVRIIGDGCIFGISGKFMSVRCIMVERFVVGDSGDFIV